MLGCGASRMAARRGLTQGEKMSTLVLADPKVSSENGPENGEALYEVVRGQIVELPSMSILAALIASMLQENLGPFVRQQKLGKAVTEGLFVLDPLSNIRRRPDVAFVSAERWPLDRPLPATGDWPVVPDLAVEVISPTDVMVQVIAKIKEYFAYQVKQVWVIIPGEIVYIHGSLTDVRVLAFDQELTSPLLPGFRIKLSDLINVPVS